MSWLAGCMDAVSFFHTPAYLNMQAATTLELSEEELAFYAAFGTMIRHDWRSQTRLYPGQAEESHSDGSQTDRSAFAGMGGCITIRTDQPDHLLLNRKERKGREEIAIWSQAVSSSTLS